MWALQTQEVRQASPVASPIEMPMLMRLGLNVTVVTPVTTASNAETLDHVRTLLRAVERRALPASARMPLPMTCKTALTV
jgi:hypothetical protein